MSGRYCKAILNGLIRALSESLESVLTDRLLPTTGKMTEERAAELLDQLVMIDLDAADGGDRASMSLLDIVATLVSSGLVTDEVWVLLRKPD